MGLDMFLYRGKHYDEAKELGYWRKANHIHTWFVNNVQDGQDDCSWYPVTQDKLRELHSICVRLRDGLILKEGEVNNGYSIRPGGEKVYHKELGKVIENPELAEELLPTQSGFFFGSTDYDEYYIDDIKHTIEVLEPLLSEDDPGDIYYHSSW
jgi:hypothetical protein